MRYKPKHILLIVVMTLFGSALLGVIGYYTIGILYMSSYTFKYSPDKWKGVETGMSESQVVKKLGKPVKIYRRQGEETKMQRTLTGYGPSSSLRAEKIYAYATGTQVFYIFFNETGHVVGWSLNGT